MSFHFAPAVRDRVSLLIALAGASGSGKTYSALRLAKGMSPDGKIAFIDTEARRGLHYAGEFKFLHTDMRPPFRPERFIEAIRSAEESGAEVVIIDNFSDEYEGEDGILEWADDLADKGVKSPGNWKDPKLAHKRMMMALLQFRASVIFCLRADEKIAITRENGKTQVVPLGWMPICEKRFMYNMTLSFTLTPDAPGRPHFDLPHKLQSQHRQFFSDKSEISEQTGQRLAAWARGDSLQPPQPNPPPEAAADEPAPPSTPVPRSSTDGAGDIPTADDYVKRWTTIVERATSAKQLHEAWVADKATRNLIDWPDDETFDKLKKRVTDGINFIKKPA